MMKKMVLTFAALFIMYVTSSAQELDKKFVLKNFEPGDKTASLITEKFNEAIKSKLIEVIGDSYQVMDMDDIRSIKGKEALADKKGFSPEIMKEILEAVGSDEIAGGTISREKDRIRISAQVFSKQGKLKSTINELFTDTELLDDYYLGEIVKKIENPKYSIKRVENTGAKVISRLEKFQPGTGISEKISVIDFKSQDDSIAKLVSILQTDLDEGDTQYKQEDYSSAITTYTAILKKITEKLSKEKQDKMKNYSDSIKNRISSSYAMILKNNLADLDVQIEKAGSDQSISTELLLDQYKELVSVYQGMPQEFQKSFKQFKNVLSNRKDAIILIDIQRLEEKANEAYREMNFEVALEKYENAKNNFDRLSDQNSSAKYNSKILKKIDTTKQSGKNYLTNRTMLLLNEVEELNLQDRTDDAKDKMKYTAELIVGSRFKNESIYKKYNTIAELLKIPRITAKTKLTDLQGTFAKKNGTVSASGGLVLRMSPSTSAAKLLIIPQGSKIAIIEETNKSETIGGKTGVWLKVFYNYQTGYVFGGFVTYSK